MQMNDRVIMNIMATVEYDGINSGILVLLTHLLPYSEPLMYGAFTLSK